MLFLREEIAPTEATEKSALAIADVARLVIHRIETAACVLAAVVTADALTAAVVALLRTQRAAFANRAEFLPE